MVPEWSTATTGAGAMAMQARASEVRTRLCEKPREEIRRKRPAVITVFSFDWGSAGFAVQIAG
jgi:hypothetical protein